jgi:hypothetical protein
MYRNEEKFQEGPINVGPTPFLKRKQTTSLTDGMKKEK